MADVDLRLLRSFLAVAEELHFGRAAARTFIAQQALSRNVARLERQLGVQLFVRSTRRVTLTTAGERLLPRARALLSTYDELLASVTRADRPLRVDVLRDRCTAARVLAKARTLTDGHALEARYHGGFGAALDALVDHRIDVAFGRSTNSRVPLPDGLVHRVVRFEPLGVILAPEHPLASGDSMPVAAMAGLTIDTSAGNAAAPEWEELAGDLVRAHGGTPAPDHHPGPAVMAAPTEETALHLRATGWPIVTHLDGPDIPGVVVLPLVDPVPLYPWSIVHRRGLRHHALDALHQAATELGEAEHWLELPPHHWFAAGDRVALGPPVAAAVDGARRRH